MHFSRQGDLIFVNEDVYVLLQHLLDVLHLGHSFVVAEEPLVVFFYEGVVVACFGTFACVHDGSVEGVDVVVLLFFGELGINVF